MNYEFCCVYFSVHLRQEHYLGVMVLPVFCAYSFVFLYVIAKYNAAAAIPATATGT
jgi:hypothetical protein